MSRHPRFLTLLSRLRAAHPEIADPEHAIRSGRVLVDGVPNPNPRSLVRSTTVVAVRAEMPLRGYRKLVAALDSFDIDVRGAIAVDAGTAAGGFTKALLDAGAAHVYAVEVGYGQLIGSLR